VEGVTATTGGHGEGQPSVRVASGHIAEGSSLLQRQDCVDLEPLATETEFVFGGPSLTEQELEQALARMPLEDESQSTDALVPGSMSVDEKGAADLKRKQRSGYKASHKFLKGHEGLDPVSPIAREKKLRKKHEYNENDNLRHANETYMP